VAEQLAVRGSVVTDVGRRRQVNEDWCGWFEPDDLGERERVGSLWVVADGVGAYGTGEEASRAAGQAILSTFRESDETDLATRLWRSILAGNRAVWERRRAYVRQGQSRPVMTTVLAVLVQGGRAILANVGDCRAYLVEHGRLTQLTRDHTWVAEQVARGLIQPAEARHHPRGHVITRSLGQAEQVEVDLFEQPLEPGDRLVLCSDGLTRHLEEAEICQLAADAPPETAVHTMLDLANLRGGEDNITVAILTISGQASATKTATPTGGRPVERVDAPRAVSSGVERRHTSGTTAEDPPRSAATAVGSVPATILASEPPASGSHLATLLAIAQRMQASLDFSETLESVMDSVVEVTGGERGFLMLWDDQSKQLVYAVGRNLEHGGRDAPEFSRNIVNQVFQSGQPLRIGDALADTRFNQYDSVVIRGLRSVLCAPLQVNDKRIGLVYVENRLGAEVFSETDQDLLCAFAAQAAIALENARLHQELKGQIDQIAVMRTNQDNVLRSINSAIISLDDLGRILTANRMAEEILGLPADLARGRALRELLPASLHRTLEAQIENPTTPSEGPDQLELEVRLPHRGRAVLTVRTLPLASTENRRIGSVLVIDDVTQQRMMAEAREREANEKERIKAVFGRYLAPSVVEQLMADPASVQLGGTRCEVSVMFADMRGFTGISERHAPEEVVKILNSYLACATEIILKNGGTLDKFLGDGVMAFFNAPLPQEGHVLAAVRAATQMQARLRELQGPTGDRIAFGVGINTGEGIVGNIGTAELMNYTIIGDVVNVAARLQGEARAGEVLLSGGAYERIADLLEVEELGSIHVKGRAQPVPIFKVVRLFD
jgi:adenylate cyclase